MRRKGRADLFVDQVLLGYGCNAIEAWGMGIPVIAGVDPEKAKAIVKQYIPPDTRDVMLSIWGELPFYESTEEGLYDSISAFLNKPSLLKKWTLRRVLLTSTDSMRQR